VYTPSLAGRFEKQPLYTSWRGIPYTQRRACDYTVLRSVITRTMHPIPATSVS
jgi:hypothetical protein